MYVDSHSVHFSCEEVFQLLHDQDLKLREQVMDLLSTSADELYLLTPIVSGKSADSVVGDGIKFDQAGVFWTNKDFLRPAKWDEIPCDFEVR